MKSNCQPTTYYDLYSHQYDKNTNISKKLNDIFLKRIIQPISGNKNDINDKKIKREHNWKLCNNVNDTSFIYDFKREVKFGLINSFIYSISSKMVKTIYRNVYSINIKK